MNDSIRKLAASGARFIVIGGHAVRYSGFQRYTRDWDLFIPPRDLKNLEIINCALEDELDMPVLPMGPKGEHFVQTFQTQWTVLQFHQIVAGIHSFDEAEAAAIEVADDGVKLKRLGGKHLLAAKEKAGRPSDQQDIQFLRKLQESGKLR